jgi:UDP-glucose 4-epimerase
VRILVTGSGGLLGGRLSQFLIHAGYDLVLGTQDPAYLKARIPFSAEIARINLEHEDGLFEACRGVDVVIHAAGLNAKDCSSNPSKAFAINGLGTSLLVKSAVRRGVSLFIFISTAHVYADPLAGAIDESCILHNEHPYAASNRVGESSVIKSSNLGEIDGLVLRASNGFGAPIHPEVKCWSLLVNDLCRQFAENGEMALKSSGEQWRDFLSINEICSMVDFLIRHTDRKIDGESVNILNLGSGSSRKVVDVAKLIRTRIGLLLGKEPNLIIPKGNPTNIAEPLDFLIKRLLKLGYVSRESEFDEIDNLILYCQKNFGKC